MKRWDELFVCRIIQFYNTLYITGRIYPSGTLCHDLRLVSSQCGQVGYQLTVHIGFIHYILINENQMPHSGAGQCFAGIRSYSTGAKYSHSGILKSPYPFFPDNAGCSLIQ